MKKSLALLALVLGFHIGSVQAQTPWGNPADAAYGGSGSASIISVLKGIYAIASGSVPAGTAIIGKVGIDQTTPGTTNAVSTTNWPSTVDTNSGNKSASTPRVVIATDQPNLTTPLNVAAASLPLPTGASTAAKQPALGTAGTAATDVLTVQGIASMTPLLSAQSGNWTTRVVGNAGATLDGAVGAGTAPTDMLAVGGVYNSTPITLTNGQSAALQLDTAGNLQIDVKTSVLPTGAATSAKQPALGTAGTASTDVLTVQGITSMTPLKVDGSGVTQPISAGSLPLPAGAATSANQTAVQGTIGAGTAPASMEVGGAVYNSSAPTPSTGQSLALQSDYRGRLHTSNLPATSFMVNGTATQTSTTSTSLIGAVSSNRIYVTGFACYNSGSSASVISFQDGSGGTTLWQTIVPAGGGSNMDGNLPLFKTTSGNALYFAPGTASTTVGCSAAGFSGA